MTPRLGAARLGRSRMKYIDSWRATADTGRQLERMPSYEARFDALSVVLSLVIHK